MTLTHGALFNGIAGFPLAAAWAGIPTEWTVEIDEFCNKVSKKHFPDAQQYTDIHEARNLPYVDIISGGFPCQPYSVAGKQLGKEDDRALWPQMLRIIKEVKPAYVIGENVAGLISMALDDVLASLEDEGYTTETFIVPAHAVGAPHKRDRVWILAYSGCTGWHRRGIISNGENQNETLGANLHLSVKGLSAFGASANANGERCEEHEPATVTEGAGRVSRFNFEGGIIADTNQQYGYSTGFRASKASQQQKAGLRQMPNFRLTESPVCGPNDGLSTGLVRDRAKQLKAYGNAIVPQVAYEIFKAVQSIAPSP